MVFHLIILTTILSLFSQVKCRTYFPEKDFVDYNLKSRQTYDLTHNPTEKRQIVFIDKGQYPNGWSENIMKVDRSPVIFADKVPVTINYRGGHSVPGQPTDEFRNSCPIVVTSQGKITVNYDDSRDDITSASSQHIGELPSGIVMPYSKFKTISPYLLAEDKKYDIRVLLDNENMTYKQFQETLLYNGDCGDLEQDSPRPSEIGSANHVTLANGTLKMGMDDYRNIVSSITSGSETLMVPNVVSGKYWLYRSLIADELPELIASAFVITHEGIVVPFSTYYAVDREHFQSLTTAVVVPKVRRIKWRDGKLVDVQTVRHVIDALRTPTMISFVLPNGKRMPFVRRSVDEEPTELYDYDPEKVLVDVGQCKNVLLSHFNDILKAVHIPDDRCKYKRFKSPAVFALDPTCLNTTSAQPLDGKVCKQSNEVDDRKYSGYSIHVINKEKPRIEDKPVDKKLTVFGPVSAMEKTTGLDSNDTIRIILTSSTGTHEIKITNILNNKKPLIYDVTDKPIYVLDLTKNMSQNECNYSPVYLMNKTNISNVKGPVNPQTNNNCTNILKAYSKCNCKQFLTNNEKNRTIDIKNMPIKNPLHSSESKKNQTVTGCNENHMIKNNKNQTTDAVITTTVIQNNTEFMNTTTNPSACGKMNNITTIDTKNNATKNPDSTESNTKNYQNCSNPVTGYKEVPTMNDNNQNQTETKNTTTSPNLANNASNSNFTNTDKKYEPNNTNSNHTVITETRNNTATDQKNNQNSSNPVTGYKEVPTMNDNNQNQTETKNTTTSPNLANNTSNSNFTNTDKKYEPNNTNSNHTVITETRNNTATDQKNNQNSSNPITKRNTIHTTTAGDPETKNTTILSAPNVTENTTGSNNTNTEKIHGPNDTRNDTVTTETFNNTTSDPNHTAVVTENRKNGSNPVNGTNEIPAVTNHYQNPTETKNTTASTPNYTENTNPGSNVGREDNDTYTGSNETPGANNTAETIPTSGATRADDAADDVGPVENPETIPETNSGINDDTSDDPYDITTTGQTETDQPAPIYTETIKSPSNNSVTNNASQIINIIVY